MGAGPAAAVGVALAAAVMRQPRGRAGQLLQRHMDGWRAPRAVLAEVDGPVRKRHLDLIRLEGLLHAPIELATDRPLLARQRLQPELQDYRGFLELVEADHLQRSEDRLAEPLVGAQFLV